MAAHAPLARRVNPLKRRLVGGFVRHHLPATDPRVELTFDDGPHPIYTPLVLERLAKSGIRASFFVVGRYVLRHRSTLREIHAAGHRIGNHSLTHPRFGPLSFPSILNEIRCCQHAIEDFTGLKPTTTAMDTPHHTARLISQCHADAARFEALGVSDTC